MRNPDPRKTENARGREDSDVSFGNGLIFLFVYFVLSNLFQTFYDRYFAESFTSTWTVYLIAFLLFFLAPLIGVLAGWRARFMVWAKSLNLGILLIVVTTVATILGTLVFQNRLPHEYVDAYGESLFKAFVTVHMVDIFHSVWFVNFLFLLIINIAVCYVTRRAFGWRHLGGYVLHFGIVVSLAGAFIGFVYGVKGVIQFTEGERAGEFVPRTGFRQASIPLGFEIRLDDFTIEWYEPKYLVNTFRMAREGGSLVSSLNVQKKNELAVEEAGIGFEVLRFSENGRTDGLVPSTSVAEAAAESGVIRDPPYPVLMLMIEDTEGRMRGEDAKASGWLAAYHETRNKFSDVMGTGAVVRFAWEKPPDLAQLLAGAGTQKVASPEGGSFAQDEHTLTYTVGGAKKSIVVEQGQAYRLEGTPYIARVTGYYADFRIEGSKPYSASDVPNNPALTVEVTDTEDPGKDFGTLYLFAREELRGMMHKEDLPGGLELEFSSSGAASGEGGIEVFIVGGEERVYIFQGGRLASENPIELGSPVAFEASGRELILSIQELYPDEPLCELVVREDGRADTLVISPLFGEPLRHERSGYVSTFQRERDIEDYKSRVTVFEDGREVMAKTIEVNHPLIYGGWSVYQQSYNETNWTWTGFEVVRDPGLWVVYTGFGMMCLGSIYVFYVRPRIRKA
jgi:hypothetical protein